MQKCFKVTFILVKLRESVPCFESWSRIYVWTDTQSINFDTQICICSNWPDFTISKTITVLGWDLH